MFRAIRQIHRKFIANSSLKFIANSSQIHRPFFVCFSVFSSEIACFFSFCPWARKKTQKSKSNEVLFVEKYRPQRIDDTILPEKTKAMFKKFVTDNNVPNLLLTGGPGVGKTTVAKAMLNEMGCDYIVKNGSLNVNIDTLRYEISTFASAVSLQGGRKYVIFDEADYLNAANVQPALRNFIEEYSSNCGFIFTCNFKNRIIAPLRSRLSEVDFSIEQSDRPLLAAQFYKRVRAILDQEILDMITRLSQK